MRKAGGIASAGLALMVSACSGSQTPPPSDPTPAAPPQKPAPDKAGTPKAQDASAAGVVAGPPLDTLPVTEEMAARALTAFRISCPALVKRNDRSGLSEGNDWREACDAAANVAPGAARNFFLNHFAAVRVGDGKAFATGYYEPEIRAARNRGGVYQTPIYARPADLVDVDLGRFSESLSGKHVRGRVDGTDLVPYYDRAEIEEGALDGRGLELAWAADPVEVFFLQIQGSGRLRLPDGSVIRIGYAGQNGRSYTGIGRLMLDRGLIGRDQASMQGMVAWLHANPEQGRAIMRENKSFVFFRVLDGPGPLGALGLPVTARASVAADPDFVPLGAPVFLTTDRGEANGLWVVQDTGGAIKGANRFDTFWGAGDSAREIAGGMSARGTSYILLPKAAAERAIAHGTPGS
ncbi:murein transglycosylase A [Stakelama pacifica]|uniref:peptidoglycan lytic exotransglycosylase n=1 Tax=Stakelama pacifica TaxID=517720 RepID=A0A4R6FBL6_9SPHN|nr:murein transglycosylase A [Stakelama pacifica]TDN78571.1 membrane-bound lytic murein transglycosylase A [Stakelama pacifica]GGO99292.1 murein transglycosylase [Stakelama pacifica]